MTWRDAFLRQARSDYAVWQKLGTPGVEYSHRLHYLQMVAEKLAKGLLCDPGSATPPAPTHAAFVRLLQVLKTRPEIRRQLGYTDASVFKRFLDSLLDLGAKIEGLAPSAAGFAHPNPEYPWRDSNSGNRCPVRVPVPRIRSERTPNAEDRCTDSRSIESCCLTRSMRGQSIIPELAGQHGGQSSQISCNLSVESPK
jgi:hypothetical protein